MPHCVVCYPGAGLTILSRWQGSQDGPHDPSHTRDMSMRQAVMKGACGWHAHVQEEALCQLFHERPGMEGRANARKEQEAVVFLAECAHSSEQRLQRGQGVS